MKKDIVSQIDRFLAEAGKSWGDVSHPGILEVPEGKDVQDLSKAHFEKLAKSKGAGAVVKALMNLYRWNKEKNPGLSSWAHSMAKSIGGEEKED